MKLDENKLKHLLNLSYSQELSLPFIKKEIRVSDYQSRLYMAVVNNAHLLIDNDIIEGNVALAKKNQGLSDSNRIERKSFREYARVENALKALNEAVIKQFGEINFNIPECNSMQCFDDCDSAIVQLSDTHFNELVDLVNNKYDFEVASKRLMLYAMEIKRTLGAYGVTKIVLAMTGDMINSDRRLDEKLNMSTNRMTAALLATNLIQYFINDLLSEFVEIDVVYVTGNESRVDEFGFTDIVITDNYDTSIYNMLKLVFKGKERVNFIDSNPAETVVSINGKNILLFHGTTVGKDTQAGIQKIIGKYAGKGIIIDYCLFGHIHFANVTDLYARSGSLVGNNTYSDLGLNLITRPSQNLTIIRGNGEIISTRVGLKQTEEIEGYPIRTDLDAYNAKSASKLHQNYKVLEIVV